MRGDLRSPGELLALMNECIHRAARGALFMTCAAAIFDTASSRVSLSSAGHPPPALIRMRDGTRHVDMLVAPADPLGWSRDTRYANRVVDVAPGDVLVWYTDGMIDSEDARQRPVGVRRFLHWLSGAPLGDARGIRDFLVEHVSKHCAGAALRDDMTLLVAEIN
jgi:sigma-B regulation protein RsbU (phosphoserine phosphatase)